MMLKKHVPWISLLACGVLVGGATFATAAGVAGRATGAKRVAVKRVEASSEQAGFPASGGADGERFSVKRGQLWKGSPEAEAWTWTVDFGTPKSVGAILQILGDEGSVVSSGPLAYVWQASVDGVAWDDLPATKMDEDRRMYRIIRLPEAVRARYLRLAVSGSGEAPPAVREVEFYETPNAAIEFPQWLVVASSHHDENVSDCHWFLELARRCEGYQDVTAQYAWHPHVDREFASVEPRPLCIFLTGSYADWCQVDRAGWKGIEA